MRSDASASPPGESTRSTTAATLLSLASARSLGMSESGVMDAEDAEVALPRMAPAVRSTTTRFLPLRSPNAVGDTAWYLRRATRRSGFSGLSPGAVRCFRSSISSSSYLRPSSQPPCASCAVSYTPASSRSRTSCSLLPRAAATVATQSAYVSSRMHCSCSRCSAAMVRRSSWSPALLYAPMRCTCGSTPTLSSTPRRNVPPTAKPRRERDAVGGA
mmetsp:Transcript_7385/g.18345  ORF Transcript_7385/g.18345 Transcript_7385/m.18345 type:complete len:216 (-) Transcript_7385:752-1399(-)